MDVVVVGSCNTDLLSHVPRLPVPGETIHGTKFVTGCGGKGANQCVMAAKMGANAAMVAKIGDDFYGHSMVKNFEDNNISTDLVTVTKEAATGVAAIAVDDAGRNSIIIVSGANLLLGKEELAAAEHVIKQAKLLVCQLEISLDCTLAALKMAKKHNVRTLLNPAPAVAGIDHELLQHVDILCPNETEAEIITGSKVETDEEIASALKTLLTFGCDVVMVTLGERGVAYSTQQHPTPVHVKCPTVKVKDTTGAGDAFVGALAYYLTREDLQLQESVSRAVQVASISVQASGTQTSYPNRQQVQHLL